MDTGLRRCDGIAAWFAVGKIGQRDALWEAPPMGKANWETPR